MKVHHAAALSAALVLSLAATAVFAATVSFVKKAPAGGLGNFNYTYTYSCNGGKKGTLTVSSANDNAARRLTELEAADRCGES
jgi:hypothetical protein